MNRNEEKLKRMLRRAAAKHVKIVRELKKLKAKTAKAVR